MFLFYFHRFCQTKLKNRLKLSINVFFYSFRNQLSICIYAEASESNLLDDLMNGILDAGISTFDGTMKVTANYVRDCENIRKSEGIHDGIESKKQKINENEKQQERMDNELQELEKMCNSYENLHIVVTQNLEKFKQLKQKLVTNGLKKADSNV